MKIAADRADQFSFGAIELDLDDWREGQTLAVSQAKHYLLAQIGIPAGDIATDSRALDQQFLSAMVTRRLLLVVHDARGVKEIEPFAAASVANLVLVTTSQLTDDLRMAYRHHVLLDRLEARGGWDMLASICGPSMLQTNPQATEELLELCDHLPQPITYVGVQLQRRRGQSGAVSELLDHLRAVGVGNAHEVVREALSETFRGLTRELTADCVLLARHPGPDFSVDSAQALLGRPALPVIDGLTDAGMVSSTGSGRWRLHHAVRTYAVGLAETIGVDFTSGFLRLLDHQRDRAVGADFADGADRLRRYPRPDVIRQVRADETISALDQERAGLLELVREASQQGFHTAVCQIGGALEVMVNKKGGYHWYCSLNEHVIASAEALLAEAGPDKPLALVARVHMMQARMFLLMHVFDRARAELDKAWPYVERSADEQLRSSFLEFAGRLSEEWTKASGSPDYREAIGYLSQAVDIDRSIQDGRAFGIHVRMLGNVLVEAGRAGEVRPMLERAMSFVTDGRNQARFHMVMARADIELRALASARAALDTARTILTAAGASQYNWELEEREAEHAVAAKRVADARARWAGLVQAAFNTGHPKAYRYLNELERVAGRGRR
ncbi:hypothetical protein [Kibdelosporangium phytohabitans]|uniref:hypothetical protein n=1 Tax=Kibdelosporangium phytohabitans TaxID=860235 RepID=UPI0012FB0604|nr:hypothetical protein [Kibdelosporangium phytohabitans]MBE1467372.1 tetratricopeptide (TPR) repeat protein [Kibdelosporangium phytohabitans]